jgi:hypothetical protein
LTVLKFTRLLLPPNADAGVLPLKENPMRIGKRVIPATLALLLAAAPFLPLLTVDQQFEGPFPPGFLLGMNTETGVTQSFVPTANRLDAVDILLGGGGTNPELTLPVTIRTSLNGPVIGTSSITVPANLLADAPNPVAFQATFSPFVPLTPGVKYYINVGPDGGQNIGPAFSFDDGYPAGEGYQGDFTLPGFDGGFRTYAGTSGVGPPANKDACKDGGWATFTIPRAFKNQGDCIQFVNTGK